MDESARSKMKARFTCKLELEAAKQVHTLVSNDEHHVSVIML